MRRRALSTSAPPWLHRGTSWGHPKAPFWPKVEHTFLAESSPAISSFSDDGSCGLWCHRTSAGTCVSLQLPGLLRQRVSLHESWDTAPQLVWSLCHQSLQSSLSDNLECPYLRRPQTVPIKRILDFSPSRDVIHSQ